MPVTQTLSDSRIECLTREIESIRAGRNQSDHQQNEIMLKMTEIQLNLAVQDKTLGKLEASINGNGRPGILTRLDRVESLAIGLTKAVWVLVTAGVAGVVKLLLERM